LYEPGAAAAGAEAALVERLARWRQRKQERQRADEKGAPPG
jgi:hypothetical protein